MHDAWRFVGAFLEEERWETGQVVSGAVLILASRECPWRCVMCDLWKHALPGPTPTGAIPAQITAGLASLGPQVRRGTRLRQVKLYNGGSFFDGGAVPPADHASIADLVRGFERVVVECHPALVGERVLRFRDRLAAAPGGVAGELEVAMGLETAHPEVLAKLNKGMCLDTFAAAAAYLVRHGISVRAFVLVQPPFLDPAVSVDWAIRSTGFAFECGVGVVSLVPVRANSGALAVLRLQGQFVPPSLRCVEASLCGGIALGGGRVFADLWDLAGFSDCALCFETRRARMDAMNRTQQVLPEVKCSCRNGALVAGFGQGQAPKRA